MKFSVTIIFLSNSAKLWNDRKDLVKGVIFQLGLLFLTCDGVVQLIIEPAVLSVQLTGTPNDEKPFAKLDCAVSNNDKQ